jgi:serine/threonine protein kinase
MLTTQKNTSLQIPAKPFASGGEGAVYHLIAPKHLSKQIVKVFKPSKQTPEREAKMKYMLANPPAYLNDPSNSLVWAKELVYEKEQFVGYTMDMAYGVKLAYLCGSKIPKNIGKDFQKYDFKYKEAYLWRLKLAFNLAVAVVQLHKTGKYVAVDLKPDNIMVQANGKIALIDMDSIEVIENDKVLYAASAHTPEFAPWERLEIGKDLIPETWDRFGLAVNIYKLLFGVHPFTGTCKAPYENCNNVEQMIENGLFPFTKGEHFEVVPPPHKRFLQSDLEVQSLFKKCFDKDTKPQDRPTPMNWCEALLPYARMVLDAPKIEEEKPKRKERSHKKIGEKLKTSKASWFNFSPKKQKRNMPFQGTKVSWWKKFTRIQDRITPEAIMMFLLVIGGIVGTSANYVSKKIQEIERVENLKQYEIFVKQGVRSLEKNDAKEAIFSFSQALKYKPDDAFADKKLRFLKKEEFQQSGDTFFAQKLYAEAVEQYDNALIQMKDSLVEAKRADAVFADATENGDIASHFDIKLKIRKLPHYLYKNCANEIFITAYDLGHHFQPSYEVEGAQLIQKEKKGRITLIPDGDAQKVVLRFKNKDSLVYAFDFETVKAPAPEITITPFWKGQFDTPFINISAVAATNFSAYYRSDAIYKVSKWRFSVLRNNIPLQSKIFSNTLVDTKEFKNLYASGVEKQTEIADKWQIEILEVVRRNYKGEYEIVEMEGVKTKFIYNQYFEEIL